MLRTQSYCIAGTPEIAGLTVIQGLEIVRGCRGLNIVSADVVEVSNDTKIYCKFVSTSSISCFRNGYLSGWIDCMGCL